MCACRNADTLKRLQDTEKLQKEQTESAYVNLDISNEEKEKGNQVSRLDCSSSLCEFWCDQAYWCRSSILAISQQWKERRHQVLQFFVCVCVKCEKIGSSASCMHAHTCFCWLRLQACCLAYTSIVSNMSVVVLLLLHCRTVALRSKSYLCKLRTRVANAACCLPPNICSQSGSVAP